MVSGTFDNWKMVPGGSSTLLHFEIPIKMGSALIKNSGKSYALDNSVALLQLQLDFISGVNNNKELKFNCTVVGKEPNDITPGAVTVLKIDMPENEITQDSSGIAEDLLKFALASCLIQNCDQLAFVVASILTISTDIPKWLTVKQMTYVYQQDVNDVLGNFAILGVLSDCDITSYSHVFDANLLREGDDFGFILAGDRVLENIILKD